MSDDGGSAIGETPQASSERALLRLVALAALLIPLNSTMLAVALPAVVDGVDAPVDEGSWLVSGYLVAMACLQPVGGRLGDRIGRRSAVAGGLAAFGAASVLGALAPSLAVLIVARVGQAAAGAVVFPNALALVRERVGAERRGAAIGKLGAVAGLASAVGLPLGGVLAELDWRALFLVNVPLVVLALLMVPRVMESGGRGEEVRARGAVRRALRSRGFRAANAGTALANLALYAVLLALPVILVEEEGWSSAGVGAALVPFAIALIVVSPFAGRLAARAGRRTPAIGGLCVFAAALLALAAAGGDLPPVVLGLLLLVAGAGAGAATPALQVAALEALDARDAGVAAGLVSTSRYVGSIIASAALGLAATGGTGDVVALLWLAAAGAAAGAVVSAGVSGARRRSGPSAAASPGPASASRS
ncbi:MAG TPA: MFS transporter [Solirubrobacteraceae bacterium]